MARGLGWGLGWLAWPLPHGRDEHGLRLAALGASIVDDAVLQRQGAVCVWFSLLLVVVVG